MGAWCAGYLRLDMEKNVQRFMGQGHHLRRLFLQNIILSENNTLRCLFLNKFLQAFFTNNTSTLPSLGDPTFVELFDLAQGNSEHSRHWFFGGKMVIDGVEQPKTLFQMVKAPYQKLKLKDGPSNCSTIAFNDNSSAMRGKKVTLPLPLGTGTGPAPYHSTEQDLDVTLTAETHNFPCGIAPLPGAETGAGGRMRDNHSTGRGAYVQAGVAGYCVGNLHLSGASKEEWEKFPGAEAYPSNMATPLDILVGDHGGVFLAGGRGSYYLLRRSSRLISVEGGR